MPIVTVRTPTGEEIQVNAPEGSSDEDIFAFVQSQMGSEPVGTPPAPAVPEVQEAPAPVAETPEPGQLPPEVMDFARKTQAQALGFLGDMKEAEALDPEGAKEGQQSAALAGAAALPVLGATLPARIGLSAITGAAGGAIQPGGVMEKVAQAGLGAVFGPLGTIGAAGLAKLAGVGAGVLDKVLPKRVVRHAIESAENVKGHVAKDAKIALAEAEEVGFNMPLAAATENSTLASLQGELASSAKDLPKLQKIMRENSANLVKQVDDLAGQLGGNVGDKAAVGSKIIKSTDRAISQLRKSRSAAWDEGMDEAIKVSGTAKVIQPRSTLASIDDTLDDIRSGRLDVSPSLESKLVKLRGDMSDGLDVRQLQKNLKAFRRNGQVRNENSGVWNDLLHSLKGELDNVAPTTQAGQLLQTTRQNYAVASEEIAALETGVLGKAIKAASNGSIKSGSQLVKQITKMEPSEYAQVAPLLKRYAPDTHGAVQARFLLDALESAKTAGDDVTGVSLDRFVKGLPSDDMFNTVFAGADDLTKGQMAKVISSVKKLDTFNKPLRGTSGSQDAEKLEALAGGAVFGSISPVFSASAIGRILRPGQLAEILIDPKGRKVLDEVIQKSQSKTPGPASLSKLASSYLADLLAEPEADSAQATVEAQPTEVGGIAPVATPVNEQALDHTAEVGFPENTPLNVQNSIRAASKDQGVPLSYLSTVASLESSFDPNAVSVTGARGLFQFVKSTGKTFGLNSDEDRLDPDKNAQAAAKLAKANEKTLKRAGVKDVQEWQLYLAHQQGAGRAAVIARAIENGKEPKISKSFRRAMDLNGGEGLSVIEFGRKWMDKYNSRRLEIFGK